jgi:hypothetical protein
MFGERPRATQAALLMLTTMIEWVCRLPRDGAPDRIVSDGNLTARTTEINGGDHVSLLRS